MDTTFITVGIIGVLAVVSPGPDFLIVTRNSLLYSKKVGLATALGIVTGNVWWIAASLCGISLVLSKTVLLFNVLKWVGALYLMYLGVCALLAKKQNDSGESDTLAPSVKRLTARSAFWIGFLTNILNPKCALFFVSFFSVVVAPETSVFTRCLYGAEIMLIALIWFSFLAIVLSFSGVKKTFARFSLWFERITGAVLIALGLKIALSEK